MISYLLAYSVHPVQTSLKIFFQNQTCLLTTNSPWGIHTHHTVYHTHQKLFLLLAIVPNSQFRSTMQAAVAMSSIVVLMTALLVGTATAQLRMFLNALL